MIAALALLLLAQGPATWTAVPDPATVSGPIYPSRTPRHPRRPRAAPPAPRRPPRPRRLGPRRRRPPRGWGHSRASRPPVTATRWWPPP